MKLRFCLLFAFIGLSACTPALEDCQDPDAVADGFTKQHPTKDGVCIKNGMRLYLPPVTPA